MTPARPPVQFSLRSLMAATAACALLFGVFRWLGVPPRASLFVSAVLVASLAAAAMLVMVIVRGPGADDREP